MKDVQTDNRKYRGRRTVHGVFHILTSMLHDVAIGFFVSIILLFLLMVAVYSQTNNDSVAPAPPMMLPYSDAGYGNAGYGYPVTPTTGLYYSGSSPMMQPMVTMPHYAGMMTPNAGYPYNPYNMGQYQQQNGNMPDDDESPKTVRQPVGSSSYSQYMPLRSPLLETCWENAKLLSPFNAPDGPNRGVGTPLENASWLDRPWYAGVFGGWVSGSKLISGQIDQGSGSNGGIVIGKNLNHYWGWEGRFFGSSIDIKDISDSLTPTPGRTSRLTALDLSAHYYPYGEARWRPYFKLGIGYTQQSFTDNYGVKQNINTCTAPFGFGLKYWWSDRVNVFGEVVDNIVFGNGPTKTQSDWALNFGVHFTFGTNPNYHPTVYWPQSPTY